MNAREFPSRAGAVIVGGGVMGASLAYHLEAAVRRFPLLETAGLAHHWAGLYEMSPDAHPLIGRLAAFDNAFVMAGFSGHGFMHGRIAGKFLAQIMLDGAAQTLDVSALDPNRFAGESATEREYNVV